MCAELFQRQRAFFNNNSPVYLQEYLPRVLYCEFVPLELDMNLRVYLGVLEKTWIAKLHGDEQNFSVEDRLWLCMPDMVEISMNEGIS